MRSPYRVPAAPSNRPSKPSCAPHEHLHTSFLLLIMSVPWLGYAATGTWSQTELAVSALALILLTGELLGGRARCTRRATLAAGGCASRENTM